MSRELSSRVHQYNETSDVVRFPYSNVTETVLVLCKQSNSHKNISAKQNELWTAEPSIWSIIGYSVLIPVVSALGIIGNSLILAVHNKAKTYLKSSTYTYLAVLASSDLVTCVLLLFSGLARGVFRCNKGWLAYEAFVYFPLGSVTSSITVWAALGMSVDRLVLICSMPRCKPPKYCSQQVAKRLMTCAVCIAVLLNIPYCFMYAYNSNGDLITNSFFHSKWYNWQNWFHFVIFGLIPAVFLFISNGIMIRFVIKSLRQKKILLKRKSIRESNCVQNQVRLTTMLISIVFLFLVGELPTHFASRRSAVSLLYGGDITKVQETFMEKFRVWATLFNALSSSTNFILYCLLSPCFLVHLKRMCLPEHLVKKSCPRGPIAYSHHQPEGKAKYEIFVL